MSYSRGRTFFMSFFCLCFGLSSAPFVFSMFSKVPLSLPLEKAFWKNSNLFQQHALNGIFIGGLNYGKWCSDIRTSTLRVSDQYWKALPWTSINFRISWDDNRFSGNDIESSQRESPLRTESIQGNARKRECNSKGIKQNNKKVKKLINLSHLYRGKNYNFGRSMEKTVMMERNFESVKQKIFNFFPISNNNGVRSFITKVGSELPKSNNRTYMFRGRTRVSHYCFVAQGS